MRSDKDVEAYLLRMNRRFSNVDEQSHTFLVTSSENMPAIAVRVDPPLVVMRVHIGDVPGDNAALFRRLLELNAKALVHSSFGLEDNRIVLSSALELANLDFNELEATLDEIDVALAQHVPILADLSRGNSSDGGSPKAAR